MTDFGKISGLFHIDGEAIPAGFDSHTGLVTIAVEPELRAALRAGAAARPARFSWAVGEHIDGEATYVRTVDGFDEFQFSRHSTPSEQ